MAASIVFSVTDTARIVFDDDTDRVQAWRNRPENQLMGTTRGPVPLEVLPRRYRMTRGKRMYDYNSGVVSARLKAAIEAIEPNVHQFTPVTILKQDGCECDQPFWAMHICADIDAIKPTSAVEKFWITSTPELEPDKYDWTVISREDNADLAVDAETIKGRAIWTDRRMSYIDVFVSDALRFQWSQAGMLGWDERDYWREE